jgi:hypothetical protein
MSENGIDQVNTIQPFGYAEGRRVRGVSLDSVAEATKISMLFLRSIEAEEFDKLPGGVYNTNYIRQYAACAGIDESAILARHRAFLESRGDGLGACNPPRGSSLLKHPLGRLLRVWRRGNITGRAAQHSAP